MVVNSLAVRSVSPSEPKGSSTSWLTFDNLKVAILPLLTLCIFIYQLFFRSTPQSQKVGVKGTSRSQAF